MRRHKHHWFEVQRRYTGASIGLDAQRGSSVPSRLIEMLAFGVTNIEFRCECTEVRFEQVIGRL